MPLTSSDDDDLDKHATGDRDKNTGEDISGDSMMQSPVISDGVEVGNFENEDVDLIFQCGTCRSVVGDTRTEYEAHLDSKTLSLKGAYGVTVEDKLFVSESGHDAGCAYKVIVCEECKNNLGRMYTSTNAKLDSRRSAFTFDHSALTSYQLGSGKTFDGNQAPVMKRSAHISKSEKKDIAPEGTMAGVSVEAFDALDMHVGAIAEATNNLTEAFEQNRTAVSHLRDSLADNDASVSEIRNGLEHTQNMILLWEERFRRLEDCEKNLEKVKSDCHRYSLCENRVSQIENIICNVGRGEGGNSMSRRQPKPIKASPSIRKSSSSGKVIVMRRQK